MRNIRKISCLSLLLFLVCRPAFSQPDREVYHSPFEDFQISYPKYFVRVDPAAAPAVLILKHRQNGFPTFNIVVQPGKYDFGESITAQKERLLHSYRLVGITDVRLLSAEIKNQAGRTYFSAELSYQSQFGQIASSLAIFSSTDKHYILTYLCPIRICRQPDGLEMLISSFSGPKLIHLNSSPLSKNDRGLLGRLMLTLLMIGLLCIIVTILKRRK